LLNQRQEVDFTGINPSYWLDNQEPTHGECYVGKLHLLGAPQFCGLPSLR
jgi:hypothetical protein